MTLFANQVTVTDAGLRTSTCFGSHLSTHKGEPGAKQGKVAEWPIGRSGGRAPSAGQLLDMRCSLGVGHRLAPMQSVFPQTRKTDAEDSTQLIVTTARFCCPKLTLKFSHRIRRQLGFPGGSVVKNPPANAGDSGSIPESGRSPWRRKWEPTSVFLAGESHGQSLVGYSLWGCKE